jgi:hypothetical protein
MRSERGEGARDHRLDARGNLARCFVYFLLQGEPMTPLEQILASLTSLGEAIARIEAKLAELDQALEKVVNTIS